MQKAKGKGGCENTARPDDYPSQMEPVPQRHPGGAMADSPELACVPCFERV